MENLISKRELLEKYGISYGALYRWKRMGLIPEDWFIRRSTPTGQETFFNRDQICERIDIIKSREASSLARLAKELSGRDDGRLIVKARFAEHEFALGDIISVCIKGTDGGDKTLFEKKEDE